MDITDVLSLKELRAIDMIVEMSPEQIIIDYLGASCIEITLSEIMTLTIHFRSSEECQIVDTYLSEVLFEYAFEYELWGDSYNAI